MHVAREVVQALLLLLFSVEDPAFVHHTFLGGRGVWGGGGGGAWTGDENGGSRWDRGH